MDTIKNIQILWNYTEANLWVDSKQNISVISNWNLVYRFIKIIFNFNGGITEKINEAVQKTFEDVYTKQQNNSNCLFYVYDTHDIVNTPLYPVFLLAERVKLSYQFKMNIQICEIVAKITNEQTELFPNSQELPYPHTNKKILAGIEKKESHPAHNCFV